MSPFSRRRVLRGVLNGGAVTIGLPLLNCFLNGNGNALANGEKMPVRFGTWFWGLGMNTEIFVPKQTGANFDFPEEIAALKPQAKNINILSNGFAFRDNSPVLCHFTGWVVARTGRAPDNRTLPGETYDVKIANTISRTRRFKQLTVNSAADARVSMSYENPTTPNPAEFSPLSFYTRVFGPEFPDPNAKDFRPDPRVMIRKSVLSGVMDEVKSFNSKVGAEDKARLDQYLTGLRGIEQQFELRLQKPEPIEACKPGAKPKDVGADLSNASPAVMDRHKLMTDLLAMAVACDQTRVFNMAYAAAFSNTTKPGYDKPHHTTTHEEGIDPVLGYQPTVSWFTRRCMEGFEYFVSAFDKIKEGEGTLLDNMFIVADTDHGFARLHELGKMPMLTAGKAGGKLKTGLHVDMKGTSISRMGYTALRSFGIEIESFGDRSNLTSSEISEILA
jgi:hypothetical protein